MSSSASWNSRPSSLSAPITCSLVTRIGRFCNPPCPRPPRPAPSAGGVVRSEEHTPALPSLRHLVCRLLLEKTVGVFGAPVLGLLVLAPAGGGWLAGRR